MAAVPNPEAPRAPARPPLVHIAAGLGFALGLVACADDAPRVTRLEALEAATYMAPEADAPIALSEGSATDPSGTRYELTATAEGDLDFDEEPDAAAILVESEGEVRLFRLHALLSDGLRIRDVAARLLGDRVGVTQLSIDEGVIRVDLMLRERGEPVTARPTVAYTQHFVLTDRGLTPTVVTRVADGEPRAHPDTGEPRDEPAGSASEDGPALHTHEWILERAEMGEGPGAEDLSVLEQPVRLRFVAELAGPDAASGRLTGFAGCNRLFGGFRAEEPAALRVAGLATTRKTCDPGLQGFETRLLAALAANESYEISGGRLTLTFEGGSLEFRAGGRLMPFEAEAPGMETPAPSQPAAGAGARRTT